MDFKGIPWVGDIVNKFESMCVEVDEIIAKDTVKYVENQMFTVGANMKKFYSEVIEDLLLPSSPDLIKEENENFSCEVQNNIDDSVNSIVNSTDEENVKYTISIADNDANNAISSSPTTYEPKLQTSLEQSCASDSLESHCAIKDLDNSQDCEHKSCDIPTMHADVEKYSCEDLTCTVVSKIDEEIDEVRESKVNESKEKKVDIFEGMVENNKGVDVVEKFSCVVTNTTISQHVGSALSRHVSISDVISNLSSVLEVNESKVEVCIFEGMEENNKGVVDIKKTPCVVTNTTISQQVGSALSRPVSICVETLNPSIRNNIESGDADSLVFKQLDWLKLGESCVMVEKSGRFDEKKSYKKKIIDALFRKRWLKGNHDKKKLALWYEEQTGNKLLRAGKRAALQEDGLDLDLDWELL